MALGQLRMLWAIFRALLNTYIIRTSCVCTVVDVSPEWSYPLQRSASVIPSKLWYEKPLESAQVALDDRLTSKL